MSSKIVDQLMKNHTKPIIQYLVPFYKEKFVDINHVTKWFKLYNHFYLNSIGKKNLDNFVQACYSPETYASGVTFVGNGAVSDNLKYLKWLTVRHRLVIELGRSTKNGWYFGELWKEQTNYEQNVTEDRLNSIFDQHFNNRQIEYFDFCQFTNYQELPRLSFVNSIKLIHFNSPYVCLDVVCNGGLRIVNLIFKISELLDYPICLVDADRYQIDGINEIYTREQCLTKTDIYWAYISQSKSKHHSHILKLLKQYSDK